MTTGGAWEYCAQVLMKKMALSLEVNGLERWYFPVTAAWTLRSLRPWVRPGVNMENGASPCSSTAGPALYVLGRA